MLFRSGYNMFTGDFSVDIDNDFKKMVRMMAGVNCDLRVTLPHDLVETKIYDVVYRLLKFDLMPVNSDDNRKQLNNFISDHNKLIDLACKIARSVGR